MTKKKAENTEFKRFDTNIQRYKDLQEQKRLNKIEREKRKLKKKADAKKLRKKLRLEKKKLKKKESLKKEKRPREFYRIIVTTRKKLLVEVLSTQSKVKAIESYNKILSKNNKKIRFPVRYLNNDTEIVPANYELILMKRKCSDDPDKPLLRNEIGQLVPHESNSERMIIYKKDEFLFEETFWVYGLNNKSQRKDFDYILNEIVLRNVIRVKYPIKRILIYKNKLVIEDDDDFDMIICKNENDCARLYTELEKEIKKLKIKSVFFSGFSKEVTNSRLVEKIMDKTGWTEEKVKRRNTRP